MSVTLIATIAGLVTAFCWGTSDYLSAHTARKLRPVQIGLVTESITFLIGATLLLTAGLHLPSTEQLVRIIAYSVCMNTAYLIFLKALSVGAIGIVVPISNAYPFFTLLLALAFQQTHFNMVQIS